MGTNIDINPRIITGRGTAKVTLAVTVAAAQLAIVWLSLDNGQPLRAALAATLGVLTTATLSHPMNRRPVTRTLYRFEWAIERPAAAALWVNIGTAITWAGMNNPAWRLVYAAWALILLTTPALQGRIVTRDTVIVPTVRAYPAAVQNAATAVTATGRTAADVAAEAGLPAETIEQCVQAYKVAHILHEHGLTVDDLQTGQIPSPIAAELLAVR